MISIVAGWELGRAHSQNNPQITLNVFMVITEKKRGYPLRTRKNSKMLNPLPLGNILNDRC